MVKEPNETVDHRRVGSLECNHPVSRRLALSITTSSHAATVLSTFLPLFIFITRASEAEQPNIKKLSASHV